MTGTRTPATREAFNAWLDAEFDGIRLTDAEVNAMQAAFNAGASLPSAEAGTSSRFSDFIRNATEDEKRAVYEDVMRRATDRQNAKVASSETGNIECPDCGVIFDANWRQKEAAYRASRKNAAPQVPAKATSGDTVEQPRSIPTTATVVSSPAVAAPVASSPTERQSEPTCELPACQHRLCACGHAECNHADENVQPNCSECQCSGFRVVSSTVAVVSGETPRTDAACFKAYREDGMPLLNYVVDGLFACQLERELAVANENRRLQADAIRQYEQERDEALRAAPAAASIAATERVIEVDLIRRARHWLMTDARSTSDLRQIEDTLRALEEVERALPSATGGKSE